MTIANNYNVTIDYNAAVKLMDDILREAIAADIAPCSDQQFFAEYSRHHTVKCGAPWKLDKSNPTY